MSIDLEDALREAFGEVPDGVADRGTASERAIHRAAHLRRRRTLLVGTGSTAAVAAIVATGLVSLSLRPGTAESELRPAAPSVSAAPTRTSSQPSPDTSTSVPGSVDTSDLYHRKQIAQVGGYLLPHGDQLPSGLRYEDADQNRYATSQLNAMSDGVFLSQGLGSDVPGANHSARNDFGMVASAADLATNHSSSGKNYGDGDTRQRSVNSNITRFKSNEYAATAIAKAKAKTGPIIWFASKTRPLSWPGVPGAKGDHHLYDLGTFGAKEDYLAIQVIGPFIVSADSADPNTSTEAVTSMVANLRSAKLVK